MSYVDRITARAIQPANRPKGVSIPTTWSDGEAVSLGYYQNGAARYWESIEADFTKYTAGGYKGNSPVFALILKRMQVFSQAKFMYRRLNNGQPGELFWTPELDVLEYPSPSMSRSQFLSTMEVDNSLAGNAYSTLVDEFGNVGLHSLKGTQRNIARLRPDWVRIVVGTPEEDGDPYGPTARIVGFMYRTPNSQRDPLILLADEVAHYWSYPDPTARFRGMSWLTPAIREMMADSAATVHKGMFFENGATPNLLVRFDKDIDPDDFDAFVAKIRAQHEGAKNAYKTLFLGGGADGVPLSANFQQLEFSVTQAKGETRLAAAAGVHPTIVGLSEGLAGSSLNSGNFSAAKRIFAETTMADLWSKAAPALEKLVPAPVDQRRGSKSAHLWYDARDIPFLRDDIVAEGEAMSAQANLLKTLVEAGWEPDAAVDYAKTRDISKLANQHTGLLSVQLQEPGAKPPPNNFPPPNGNGNGNANGNGQASAATLALLKANGGGNDAS